MKKAIPVGIEDIKRIIDENLYYVDKTLMIKELLDSSPYAELFTRPRRFGKTLALSMIRRFFEMELDANGREIDNSYLFQDLAISSCGDSYGKHQQQYPVINLSLKSAKQPNFKMAQDAIINELIKEYKRHYYLLESPFLLETDKTKFLTMINREGTEFEYATGLEFLCTCLAEHHKEKVIILIDEYDVPLETAWTGAFYEDMTGFIRSIFESALKTNPHLKFAIITGCLRISRESIFTGLNNLTVHSVLSLDYTDSFGFTATEVKAMLAYYGLEEKYEEVRKWYNGYRYGSTDIYNPWSIINYTKTATLDREAFPRAYWSNTSSNSIIQELVETADFEIKQEIEALIAGATIEKPIHEDITYGEIHESNDNLWNFLYFTGYLKSVGQRLEDETIYIKLAIPNAEIRSIYRTTILSWFHRKIQTTDLSSLFEAIESGDCKTIETLISDLLLETISFYDYAESYYHGFLAGLLKTSQKYQVYSNRESGAGRPDLVLKTPTVRGGTAIIFELKVVKEFREMERGAESALRQIREQNYGGELERQGYTKIRKYGICFFHKECLVVSLKDSI